MIGDIFNVHQDSVPDYNKVRACNGDKLSKAKYQELYKLFIGSNERTAVWGEDLDTFTLPNMSPGFVIQVEE